MPLLALLLPPLYFLTQKKTGMFLMTGAMFVASCFLAMTVVMIPGALVLWFIAAFAALRDNRRKERATHADMLAAKMAEKMRDAQAK